MIKQDFVIARLIAAFLSGEITPAERTTLNAWREESETNEALFQKICSEENLKRHTEKRQDFDLSTGWSEIQKRINRKKRPAFYFHILRYAAIILLPVLVVTLSLNNTPVNQQQKDDHLLAATHILPGEAKAILTLDNGETLYLDKNSTDKKQVLSDTRIEVDSTTLNYRLAQQRAMQNTPVYNKVDIPCGGEYALVLNDGTKVRLNSLSSLRFPVVFGTGSREVELTGEAYFEVAKNGEPFIVHTNGMKIEVLGTTFNILAYPGEEYQATLVSGSVKVNSDKGGSFILKPSQQAILSPESGNIQVRTVDVAFYTSWVKGKIYFKDQRLEDIMKTLSRWYDIDVKYTNEEVKNRRFGCNVDRYEEITPFVELLEATKDVKISINNKTITFQ